MASSFGGVSKFHESSSSDKCDPWDPFSNDELLLYESLNDKQSIRVSNNINQDDGVSVNHPLDATKSSHDGSHNLGVTSPCLEGIHGSVIRTPQPELLFLRLMVFFRKIVSSCLNLLIIFI